MVKLTELRPDKGARTKFKRVGRGHGSGKGQQAGRGHKGQQSRSGGGFYQGFEGGQKPLYKRSPKLKTFQPVYTLEYAVINVGALEKLGVTDKTIDIPLLKESGLVRKCDNYLKILGDGELKLAITVKAHKFSTTAQEKITKAGGKVEIIQLSKPSKVSKKEKAIRASNAKAAKAAEAAAKPKGK